uniref:chlorophyllase n=1 Tax=Ginkgo biloba TaxID=3311 RepID=Q7Y0K5_GINBI|nr:chlorophyllase [Ginkgo biloba]
MVLVKDVFSEGPLPVQILAIPQANSSPCSKLADKNGTATTPSPCRPPKPLLIALPSQHGDYPLILFFHGYVLLNSFYSQLLRHVASHGYIAIAPQMYSVIGPNTTPEIADAAAITDWLRDGLSDNLPQALNNHVRPNFEKFVLAGHSRGGKVAFALALGRVSQPSLKYSALVGLDPVDGMGKDQQTSHPILSYREHSFDLGMPTLVVGSGLGPCKRNPLFPPCAPQGVNHHDFFYECVAPAYHFVASDYGHLDFLDDDTKGIRGKATYCLCKNGEAREPMRKFSGGIVVAFLQAFLGDNRGALNDIMVYPSHAPVKIEPPESLVTEDVKSPEVELLRRAVCR